jgi:hypothetical protein
MKIPQLMPFNTERKKLSLQLETRYKYLFWPFFQYYTCDSIQGNYAYDTFLNIENHKKGTQIIS